MNSLLFMAMGSYFLCQTIYLQAGLGWSVLKAGLAGVPFALTTTVFAGSGSRCWRRRSAARVLQIGAVTWAVGAVLMGQRPLGRRLTSLWSFLPGLIVAGAGFGLMVSPIGVFTLADVPVGEGRVGLRTVQHDRPAGRAAGVAVVGSVFFSVVDAHASRVPAEMFRPGMEAALAVLVGLMVVAAVVARQLPATMSAPPEGASSSH